MIERYGTHFTSLPIHKRGPGSPFMKAFEDIRNDFDGTAQRSSSMQLIMKNLEIGDPECMQYDTDESQVELTPSVLSSSV